MDSKSVEDMIEASSGVHFSGFHMDGLEMTNTEVGQPTTSAAEEMCKQPFVIGVAGGAASGKTTVCDMIIQQLHDQRVVLVNQDSFYHDLTEEELTRVHEYNFDHPDAFDTEQLLCAMEKLRHGQAVDIPNYDFKSYKNVFPARRVNPSDVIILEGILIFHDPRIRELMNMKIFVDTDADVRLARRIRRDIVEKGRDIATVLDQVSGFLIRRVLLMQYSKFVKPAFDDFILPTKKYADIIIPRGGDNHVAIDLIVQHIRTKLGQHDLCKIYPNLYVIQSTFQVWHPTHQSNLTMGAISNNSCLSHADTRLFTHPISCYACQVVEHGLGHLPFTEKQVTTPTGSVYTGVDFCKRLCGVSVIRSGESMENALRACCKGIKIGKILIHREGDNGQQLIYEKLPQDISDRHVLLLDPILGTGNSAVQAISLLISKGVPESQIIFLNLISAPQGVHVVCKRFPRIKIVTSEIEIGLNEDFRVIPGMGEFGDRYPVVKLPLGSRSAPLITSALVSRGALNEVGRGSRDSRGNRKNTSFQGSWSSGGLGRNAGHNKPVCYYCDELGHTRRTCWKLHGKPQQQAQVANIATQGINLVSTVSSSNDKFVLVSADEFSHFTQYQASLKSNPSTIDELVYNITTTINQASLSDPVPIKLVITQVYSRHPLPAPTSTDPSLDLPIAVRKDSVSVPKTLV
ncbi:hypothetical protein POTOM_003513 [Populus tomentosa]|uniref:Uridine kinase n=1 Tax=Populus tomentosa TaxID=118781 RepID=A0A8X8DLV2_POPTO|nr:hypothetical protein POTOM_003513 [Populus tomentosa]